MHLCAASEEEYSTMSLQELEMHPMLGDKNEQLRTVVKLGRIESQLALSYHVPVMYPSVYLLQYVGNKEIIRTIATHLT